jgi:hypothetical protein
VIKPNKQKPIGIVEVRSFRRPSSEHIDLLPQDQDFCFQLCSRPEERSQDAKNQLEQISHQAASLPRPFPASTPNRIFGTHRHLEGDAQRTADRRLLEVEQHMGRRRTGVERGRRHGGKNERASSDHDRDFSIGYWSVRRAPRHARMRLRCWDVDECGVAPPCVTRLPEARGRVCYGNAKTKRSQGYGYRHAPSLRRAA